MSRAGLNPQSHVSFQNLNDIKGAMTPDGSNKSNPNVLPANIKVRHFSDIQKSSQSFVDNAGKSDNQAVKDIGKQQQQNAQLSANAVKTANRKGIGWGLVTGAAIALAGVATFAVIVATGGLAAIPLAVGVGVAGLALGAGGGIGAGMLAKNKELGNQQEIANQQAGNEQEVGEEFDPPDIKQPLDGEENITPGDRKANYESNAMEKVSFYIDNRSDSVASNPDKYADEGHDIVDNSKNAGNNPLDGVKDDEEIVDDNEVGMQTNMGNNGEVDPNEVIPEPPKPPVNGQNDGQVNVNSQVELNQASEAKDDKSASFDQLSDDFNSYDKFYSNAMQFGGSKATSMTSARFTTFEYYVGEARSAIANGDLNALSQAMDSLREYDIN